MKPKLDIALVLAAIEAELGTISGWSTVTDGEDSQTLSLRLGTEDFILRINARAAGFEKDAFCQKRFASALLPIPGIVRIGELLGHAFCMSRRAIGCTLQDLQPAELSGIVGPVAQTMKVIASAPLGETNGFGPFNSVGEAAFPSWRAFILSVADKSHYRWESLPHSLQARTASHLSLLRDCGSLFPEKRHLVHGDFGSNNVIVSRGQVTAVIDWSEAMFGDPLYDIANIFFWRPWLPCMEAQARHFEEHHPELFNTPSLLAAYQLRIGLAELHERALAGEHRMLTWIDARCEAAARKIRFGMEEHQS